MTPAFVQRKRIDLAIEELGHQIETRGSRYQCAKCGDSWGHCSRQKVLARGACTGYVPWVPPINLEHPWHARPRKPILWHGVEIHSAREEAQEPVDLETIFGNLENVTFYFVSIFTFLATF